MQTGSIKYKNLSMEICLRKYNAKRYACHLAMNNM